ncbi:kinesin-like protein Klp59C [Drosophila subpulchrella]|uniref:kinesin-like protein Klp59C n=1 Tax=Drosophila subpulchrella TaxID=1486046 RepID=UPI0018A19BC0|nr:kinesin-like protein Klp59C [Drosophila subpulchrella]
MDRIQIGEQLFFQRSDGRVHPVVCTGKNPELDSVTGEWTEGAVVKGKEVPISMLIGINRHIFAENQPPTGSLIPKPRDASPSGGRQDSQRKSSAGTGTANPYAERMRAMDFRSKLPTAKTENNPPVPMVNRDQGGPYTSRLVPCKPRSTSPIQNRRSQGSNNNNQRCSSVVREVNRMKDEREKRRARQVEQLQEKDALRRKDPGNPNWEVSLMLRQYRGTLNFTPLRCLNPRGAAAQQITVCVRKRPMSRKEENSKNMDIITIPTSDSLIVHELRLKVDLTKFLEHHKFRFDFTFDEECSNALVYDHTARPLIRTMFEGGNATCFAYGQTGSGKTHTMGGEFFGKIQDCGTGIYAMAARDVFEEISRPEYREIGAKITCSFFEIYGSKVFDLLLPNKPMLRVLEDGRQQVVVVGLTEITVTKVEDVLRLIEHGSKERTSGQTSANAKSSRSHAVFQIALHMPNSWGPYGKCSFVDLAGNERGADTQSADRHTRIEGAEINKSLLALKECIRALSRQSSHLPFRGSKLTQVLRDSFVGGKKNKTCMIAMISPSMSCVEHTLNTLRYADRVKELIAKEDDALQNSGGTEEKSPDLNDESEPEMFAEEEEEQYDYEENQHITISSEETSSYIQHNASSDTNFNHTINMPQQQLELKEVAEQHVVLMDYMENLVRDFRELRSEEEFGSYLANSDNAFEDLLTMVNQTRDQVFKFKTQQLIKDMMQKNGQLEGNKKEENKEED